MDKKILKDLSEFQKMVRSDSDSDFEPDIRVGSFGNDHKFKKCTYGDEKPYGVCAFMCKPGQRCNIAIHEALECCSNDHDVSSADLHQDS